MGIDRIMARACTAALACMAAPAAARAQAPVALGDATAHGYAEQRRAAERERNRREALQPGTDVFGPAVQAPAGRDWPAQESPCFFIERVLLRGDAAPLFAWVLEDLQVGPDAAVGRCLGAQGVSRAAARAQQRLIERGFVTSRIVLESQDLSDGTLALTLLPGRIGAIRPAEGTSARATLHNALPSQVGDILNLREIEQALENLRRVPTVQAEIQIVPGAEPGQSELLVRWQQALPLRLSLSLDDGGSKATGRYQGSATLSVDHALALNDLFHLSLGRDLGGGAPGPRGTRNASLHYSLPLG